MVIQELGLSAVVLHHNGRLEKGERDQLMGSGMFRVFQMLLAGAPPRHDRPALAGSQRRSDLPHLLIQFIYIRSTSSLHCLSFFATRARYECRRHSLQLC